MFKTSLKEKDVCKYVEPYIGEVLVYQRIAYWDTFMYPAHKEPTRDYNEKEFVKFKESDIGLKHDEFIEIFRSFHKLENVFFYDNVYNTLRNDIMKKHKEVN